MIRHLVFSFIFFFTAQSFAVTVSEKIYILSDSLEAVDNNKFPYITFNLSNSYTQVNPVIEIDQGDS